MNFEKPLEFGSVLEMLQHCAVSEEAKIRIGALRPALTVFEANSRMEETTQAKGLIERLGTPPIATMKDLRKSLVAAETGDMLIPEQLEAISAFLTGCRRMSSYLKGAGMQGGFSLMPELSGEIERCIRNGQVDDFASSELNRLRRKIGEAAGLIKSKLGEMLRKNKAWFSEGFVYVKSGRHTLPVKKECKSYVAGNVVEVSNTGSTYFIEPAAALKLADEAASLRIEADAEIRRILFKLTDQVVDGLAELSANREAMESFDFIFAKAKLSVSMKANPVPIADEGELRLIAARHPLLNPDSAVPLDLVLGNGINGIAITGPNTGGKTVALKTVGLLSLMAQSGLHAPAEEGSTLRLFSSVCCDIGDGQSIKDNLSTFSSHMANIIGILSSAGENALVLLDELGAGTDPAEGMGIAIGVLEELAEKGCFFAVTTHYPEVKAYAENSECMVNARMAFDRESLIPLYRLEMGEAGESCALFIAQRLGMPKRILDRSREAALGDIMPKVLTPAVIPKMPNPEENSNENGPRKGKRPFEMGDSVIVYPQKGIGIVYAPADGKGLVCVQVKGKKIFVNHKRLKLKCPASELYPEDYDFSIIFDSVDSRKGRHQMDKGHVAGLVVEIEEGDRKV